MGTVVAVQEPFSEEPWYWDSRVGRDLVPKWSMGLGCTRAKKSVFGRHCPKPEGRDTTLRISSGTGETATGPQSRRKGFREGKGHDQRETDQKKGERGGSSCTSEETIAASI